MTRPHPPNFYSSQDLMDYAIRVLEKAGVPAEDAREVARCLVGANLRGVDSHGIVRLPVYVERLRVGAVRARPQITVKRSGGAAVLVDGDNGLGPVVARRAMAEALALARDHGVGLAAVMRSNHFGCAGHYIEMAIEADCIGIACSNAPPSMAPWGGRERFLGTNPVAVGIPAGEEPPLIFDIATSVVARGKIILAAQQRRSIPEGWALDREGNPTRDAVEALLGAVLPFGGPKGSGISLLIDVLSGVWTGAGFAYHLGVLEDFRREQNLGHVFLACPADLFLPLPRFKARMDEILRALRQSAPASGVTSVLAPGDPELQTAAERRAHGIPVSDDVIAQLAKTGEALGVTLPAPLRIEGH